MSSWPLDVAVETGRVEPADEVRAGFERRRQQFRRAASPA